MVKIEEEESKKVWTAESLAEKLNTTIEEVQNAKTLDWGWKDLNPKHAAAHSNLGNVLQTVRKDYDGAERHYRKTIELDPKHATAHTCLGSLLHTVRKDYDGAEKMYRKAIELDPKQTHARWNLSLILENQKHDIPGAVKLMEECIRLGGTPGFDNEQRLATLRAKL